MTYLGIKLVIIVGLNLFGPEQDPIFFDTMGQCITEAERLVKQYQIESVQCCTSVECVQVLRRDND